jgi:hypothetical protein
MTLRPTLANLQISLRPLSDPAILKHIDRRSSAIDFHVDNVKAAQRLVALLIDAVSSPGRTVQAVVDEWRGGA